MNTATIQNNKKWSIEKLAEVISNDLLEKFNLTAQTHIFKNETLPFIEVHVKGLIIPVFVDSHYEFSMSDTPEDALTRFNSPDKKSVKISIENGKFYLGLSNGYSFIHELIKHSLATHQEANYIDSDGAGLVPTTYRQEAFGSFNLWMDHLENIRSKRELIAKLYYKLSGPSKKQVIETERILFPEIMEPR